LNLTLTLNFIAMNNNKYNCIVICGPTASGKTKLAVQIARQVNGEILSADSRQVYRGMDIGTGKDLQEYGEAGRDGFVPYHLIDIADPRQIYTLYDYQRDFYKAFEDVSARGRMPVVAGGSGLYIEAVIKGYDIPPVPENVEFRKTMMAEERETLIEMLRNESPDIFARTDVSTKKRVIRALEVVRFSGKQAASNLDISHFDCTQQTTNVEPAHHHDEKKFPSITPIILYVVWERQELRARIEKRLHERLAGGLIEEAARLLDSGIDAARFALFGMEYKHAARCIRGEVSREEMAARLLQDIFHLAKRQDTWFRGMERRGMRVRTVPRAELDAALRILRG
jgi:tRNA dimethylallyltransferase